MAEPAKAIAPKSDKPRVLHLDVVETVELWPAPPQTRLTIRRDDGRPNVGATPKLEMELDRTLGGVVIRYRHKEEAFTYLVPLGNVRTMRLEE